MLFLMGVFTINAEKIGSIIFLVVGILTVLEFIFIRGMFTWLLMVSLVIICGTGNMVVRLMRHDYLSAALFALCSTALCMGYFVLLSL